MVQYSCSFYAMSTFDSMLGLVVHINEHDIFYFRVFVYGMFVPWCYD